MGKVNPIRTRLKLRKAEPPRCVCFYGALHPVVGAGDCDHRVRDGASLRVGDGTNDSAGSLALPFRQCSHHEKSRDEQRYARKGGRTH
jgi:hypothetical protein